MNAGSQAGYARANEPAQPTPSQVQVAQAGLDSNLSALHEALSALESRLQPVLAPIPETAAKNSGQVRPVASTVSQRIAESADVVGVAISRVQHLLDRLEV